MRSKRVQWLLAAALLAAASVPVWAQPALVGNEFQVNENKVSRQLQPVAVFGASGTSAVIWENDWSGILGRFYDRKGVSAGEVTLVPNRNLPGIPAKGEVLVRKDPAVLSLPNGELLLFWTEERDYLSLDHFYENRRILDQDIVVQRFDAKGKALGARTVVSPVTSSGTAAFQRRPKAALTPDGVVVVWETATIERDSTGIVGRLLTRGGRAAGEAFRVDTGRAPEVWNTAVAANAAGDFVVAWEAQDAAGPGISARFFGRAGAPAGSELTANTTTAGRQRRPAAIATRGGDFLIAWQGFQENGPHGIFGQYFSAAGARAGNEFLVSKGSSDVQVGPALAQLASGDVLVAWVDWLGAWPIGLSTVAIDNQGKARSQDVLVSQDRLYPQYRISVAAGPNGEILATWESAINRSRAIAARRLQD